MITAFLLTVSTLGFAQETQHESNRKTYCGRKRANWCALCKANGQRFGELINSYASRGVSVYFNDLTNDATTQASKKELEEAGIYHAGYYSFKKRYGKDAESLQTNR
jgi:hypothetical protein